jgi:SSS family solute:Na+ symporter
MHMPATGVFTGLALAAIFFATSNATLLQRMLGARDLAHAQNGMVFAGMLKLFAVLIIVVPGMMSAALFPGIHPDTAYAVMLKELVPAGLSGLVLATFIAALMSTTDSEIHSMSAIVTLDLLPLARRSLSPDASLMVGKLVAVFFLCWAVLLAPLVERVGLIYPIVLQSAAYLLAPAGVCFMFGRFHRRATTFAANCVLLSGLILGTLMMGWSLADAFTSQRLMGIHFYHISPVLVLTYAGMFLLLSRYGRAPTAKQLEFLKPSPTGKAMGTAGYAGNRRALALFFILIVALYVVF